MILLWTLLWLLSGKPLIFDPAHIGWFVWLIVVIYMDM